MTYRRTFRLQWEIIPRSGGEISALSTFANTTVLKEAPPNSLIMSPIRLRRTPGPKRTSRSNGTYLRENEISEALALNRMYHGWDRSIEKLAELYGYELHWRAADRRPIVAVDEARCKTEIWLPKRDEFHNFFRFAHESHHIRFAPQVIACEDLSDIEIAKWEAKANAFGALAVMPLLEYRSADMVRRAFGPELEHAAHQRLLHFEKYGY